MHAASTSIPGSIGDASTPPTNRPRRSSRSHSFSSASMVTAKRPSSRSSASTSSRNPVVPRSQSPVESRVSARLSREPQPSDHQRRRSIAVDALDQNRNEAAAGLNRWSESTTSSVTSSDHTRRKRSSSGAVLSKASDQQFSARHRPRTSVEHPTRSSPQKKSASRTNSLRQLPSPTTSPVQSRRPSRADALANTPSSLLPLHTAPSLTDSNDIESPSTAQTIATPRTQSSAYMQASYFTDAGEASPHTSPRAKRPSTARNVTAPVVMDAAQSHSREDRHDQSHRRTRTRDKADRDKKTMLSKALEKANTAVLLDNASNVEGALDAYSDACALLMQVMERTSGDDDRRKLGAISETYSHRIMELSLLIQNKPSASHEKILPARPISDRSTPPISPMPLTLSVSPTRPAELPPAFAEQPAATRASFAPRLSYHHKGDRDSFFSKTMAAVQDSMMDQDDFMGTPTVQDRTVISDAADEEPRSRKQTSVHLPPPEHAQYVPRPLTPRRPQSPQLQPQVEDAWRADPDQLAPGLEHYSPTRATSHESITWLDTINESRSSRTSSVHSLSSHDGLRRKHIRGTSGNTDAEFDAAFDAAVEAAYNEGYEPDLESRDRVGSLTQHRFEEPSAVEALGIREPVQHLQALQPSDVSTSELSDDEEERLLDEMTQDFASGLGFNFDVQNKAALPRQSDSSTYSRSTWQSSQTSDRATAATSLSTVAEDGVTHIPAKSTVTPSATVTARTEPPSLPLPPAPSKSVTSQAPSTGTSTVRNRRLSGQNPKQLKIETTGKLDGRKRASTFHHSGSPFAEADESSTLPLPEQETKLSLSPPTSSEVQTDLAVRPLPTLELHSIPDDMTRPLTASAATGYRRPSYEEFPSELQTSRPTLFRKNKSSASLREHTGHTLLLASPDLESHPTLITPMSSTFATFVAKRNQNPLTSQRANLPPFGQAAIDGPNASGVFLFDVSLTAKQGPTSPRIPALSQPASLEPCPESLLLRPFWLMRTLSNTLAHPRGGFLTTKLFVPREVWQTRGVKLKLVEDKIASCDLLTAALGRLASVDSYDVEAIMDELQSFEEVVERVQATLGKRLGNEVGIHGAANFFKDAVVSSPSDATPAGTTVDKATKSNSGKSYLSSWRKLRNKSSGTPLGSTGSSVNLSRQQSATSVVDKDHPHSHSMPSVPMTSFVPVERRGQKRDTRNLVFEGPHKEYMSSLARLFDGVQVLDQIARQVEDPGLKHSSPTHVGLELSTRHAAEFFAFYVCRFVLNDLGVLLEKFLKKGTEWVLA